MDGIKYFFYLLIEIVSQFGYKNKIYMENIFRKFITSGVSLVFFFQTSNINFEIGLFIFYLFVFIRETYNFDLHYYIKTNYINRNPIS